jgi:hypothetical protein
MIPENRNMAHMLAYLGKRLTWLITTGVVLVTGVGAAILSNSAAASGNPGNWILPNSPFNPHPHHSPPHPVPEMNTGLVLLPIVLAILLFTSRRFLRRGLESQ